MNKVYSIAILTTLYLTAPANSEGSDVDDGKLRHDQTQHEKRMRHDEQSEGTKPHTTDNVHGNIDHDAMDQGKPTPAPAQGSGVGVVHALDADKRMVNLTHEPMPELDWPAMTMDLGVTKRVDLSGVKAGDKVKFKVKLGRDKKYRITDLERSE
jgi:Cu/Ag efflux protein CusF